MTLNVSLIVPDGIVIASDSLLTLSTPISQRINVNTTCPHCKQPHEIKDVQVPPVNVPSSTFPYAQKLFSVFGRFGLAAHGSAFVNGRSMFNHVTEMVGGLESKGENYSLEMVRDEIVKYFDGQLRTEIQKAGINLALQPDDWSPFGFQLVGFSNDPKTGEPTPSVFWIRIGKSSTANQVTQPALCTGDTTVVALLWPNSNSNANFSAFSLQDAIDYTKFLIKTTADYQRFSGKLPSVGGEIDIALVTNRSGFRWIQQKELYRIISKVG